MINWILVEAVPYEGSDPTLFGASFDLYKFYSPAAAARIRETGHRNFNAWLNQDFGLWPATAVDGCQFERLDGDYVVCMAISV